MVLNQPLLATLALRTCMIVLQDYFWHTSLRVLMSRGRNGLMRSLGCTSCVAGDGERAASLGFPDVLLVIVMLSHHGDLLGYQVGRIEAHAKLSNHGNVCACLECLHECLQLALSLSQCALTFNTNLSAFKRLATVCLMHQVDATHRSALKRMQQIDSPAG